MQTFLPVGRRFLVPVLLAVAFVMASYESVVQYQDAQFVHATALSVVQQAGAKTPREQVYALRNYLRTHVSLWHAMNKPRPLLRATAAETLRSGNGFCGETARAFVCMATSLGIPARRVYLYGKTLEHVVAEAKVGPHQVIVVDAFHLWLIPDMQPIESGLPHSPFYKYATINLDRWKLGGQLASNKAEPGALNYWVENPHLLKATFWLLAAGFLLAAQKALLWIRAFRHRRQWQSVTGAEAVVESRVGETAPVVS